jgi:flagellar hook-associated protein 3 FlgL
MKATFVSTQAVSSATRLSILKMQTELAKSEKEQASGRWADMGLQLGNKTGRTVSLRQDYLRFDSIVDTNGLVASRLDASQATLTGVLDMAQDFVSTMLAIRDGETGPELAQSEGKNNLEAFISALNISQGGQYLFAGINTDVRPLNDYFAPASDAKTAVDAAFLAEFGIAQDDAGISDILPADMETFLNGDFAALFDPAAWVPDWSSASDQNVRSRISTSELVDTSANANEEALRKIAMAYTMVTEFASTGLNDDTYKAVIEKAMTTVSEAVQGVIVVQARLGTAQQRVSNANERMEVQLNILNTHINELELIDPFETMTRITTLETQLDMAYALTSRAQGLSLLNYL